MFTVELTQLYYKGKTANSIEEVQEVFAKFYATAITSERTKINECFQKIITRRLTEDIILKSLRALFLWADIPGVSQ